MRRILSAGLPFLCAASPLLAQTDRYVLGSRPGAYPDLASAVAAANPGDRILLEQSVTLYSPVTIDKSLRIQPAPGAGYVGIGMLPGHATSGGIAITGLTPGLPLEFADISFGMNDMTWTSMHGVKTTQPVQGEIRFDGASFDNNSIPGWTRQVLLSLQATEVRLRECTFTTLDQSPDGACIDSQAWGSGTCCLEVTSNTLVMEDCDLRAGSGAWLSSHPTNCFGCDLSGSYYRGCPEGGFALRANTQHTWLVRTRISDGNGGGAQPPQPPCGSYGIPARAGLSQLTGPTGQVHAYDFTHELGLDGQVTTYPAPGNVRGLVVHVGQPDAPLKMHGDAQLGGTLQATVTASPGLGAVLALAFDWIPTQTPFGTIAIDPFGFHFAFLVPPTATMQWSIPNDPAMHGAPAVAQLFPIDANLTWFASNPSSVTLRLP